jgi:uncharacterized protein with HEPN domain
VDRSDAAAVGRAGVKAGQRHDVDRVENYVGGLKRSMLEQNTLVQDAVIRNFKIIGEAANKIRPADPDPTQHNPRMRLDLAYRMRNALIHGYDSVNLGTVWNTIQTDLPPLKHQMDDLLRRLPDDAD